MDCHVGSPESASHCNQDVCFFFPSLCLLDEFPDVYCSTTKKTMQEINLVRNHCNIQVLLYITSSFSSFSETKKQKIQHSQGSFGEPFAAAEYLCGLHRL